MSVRTSPEVSSQFSAKVACRSRTAGPSTRTMVSRQRRFSPARPWSQRQWSPKPAPPRKPTSPSTTTSSRWVRLLIRGSVYQRIGW